MTNPNPTNLFSQLGSVKCLVILGLSLTLQISSYSQSFKPIVFNLAGTQSYVENYSLHWSIGESLSTPITASAFTITQGFQQTELGQATAVKDLHFEAFIHWFPNPVHHKLTLQTDYTNPLTVELFSILGKKLYKENFIGEHTITLPPLSAGSYVMKWSEHGRPVFSTLWIKH